MFWSFIFILVNTAKYKRFLSFIFILFKRASLAYRQVVCWINWKLWNYAKRWNSEHWILFLNRLSEPNLSSISGQLEELYMANSRKDMNETLTDILMNACVTAVAMPARLMMEHVLLVSVLHHTVGIEVIFVSGTNFV